MKERRLSCNICDEHFFRQHDLKIHTSKFHDDLKKITYDCQFCEKQYAGKYKLRDHVLSKHPNREND